MAIRSAEENRRFAELAARTGLEPELAARYDSDPVAVLAEFGLPAAEPLYTEGWVVIEDLTRSGAQGVAAPTVFSYAPDSRPGVSAPGAGRLATAPSAAE